MISIIDKILKRKNLTDTEIRLKYGVIASIYGVILNVVLFIIKLIIGLFSNSISIIADSINNLTDMGSSIISFFGFKLSSKPADEDHPFGHQRIEYITSFVVSIIVLVIGVELLINSITKIFSDDVVTYSNVTIIVLIISIIIKIHLAIFHNKVANKIDSKTLKATSKDSLNDVIGTTVILISALVMMFFDVNIDGYMGALVSLFILYSGITLIKETISPLIGEKTDESLVNEIISFVLENSEILGVHDVISHSYGPTKIFMSLHAEVDASSNILEIHEVIDNIEYSIKEKYNVSLVIHMDPIDLNCEVTNKYKNIINTFLHDNYPSVNFHDFRSVVATTHINIIFDIVIPFNLKIDNLTLEKELNSLLSKEEVKINLIITFEQDFSTKI